MSRPTAQERLIARLRKMGLPLPEGTRLVRTYPGYWQRRQGTWCWRAETADGTPLSIGSPATMASLLRAAAIEAETIHGDTTINPS